ncbi:MAG: hypothetical protein R3F61_23535, partial [Myxococcota bacterium]
ERIRLVIRILAEGGLIQSRSHPEQPWPDEAVVRISGAGKFYLTELIYMSEYLESIVDDLIVYQPNTASDLYDIHNDKNRTWPERLSNKVRVLVQYLRSEETRELSGVSPPPWLTRITGKFKRRA